MWIKPLSDGTFAVALINKDAASAHNMVLKLSGDTDGAVADTPPIVEWEFLLIVTMAAGDFFSGPMASATARIRDIYAYAIALWCEMYDQTYAYMDSNTLRVRAIIDAYRKRDLGNFTHMFNATVQPMDAMLLKLNFQ